MLKLNSHHIAYVMETVSIQVGRILIWLMLPLAMLTFSVVFLRYGFDFGRIALQEGITYLHAFILMLCMGYTFHENQHVRVDIFYNKMSNKKRALVNLVGNLLFLAPMCLTILITSWNYVVQSWLILEGSPESGGLPLVFILKTLIPLMAVSLLMQGIANTIRNIDTIKGN